ncbi:MAG: ECF-type sigma factor [Myxococcota bacterium]
MDGGKLTQLLHRARSGDIAAQEAVLPLVYQELRSMAQSRMRAGRPSSTLQPTALVHEAYLRSLGSQNDFENRRHFFFVAARAMKDILVDHARQKSAVKRGGDVEHVPMEESFAEAIEAPFEDMVALNHALERLEVEHTRQHQVVMLRFFGGLTHPEVGELLEVSEETVVRDWKFGRAFLFARLSDASP